MSKKGKQPRIWNGKRIGLYQDAYTIEIKYSYDKPDYDQIQMKIDIEKLINTGRAYKC